MKKTIICLSALTALGASSTASARDSYTKYNGDYELDCQSLSMTISVGLGGAVITQTESSIILNSGSANINVTVPMDCENPDAVSVDKDEMWTNTRDACVDFETNPPPGIVAENLPCDAIASASTWMWSGIANAIAPVVYTSIDMSVRRSGNWFWRWLGYDAVDWFATTASGGEESGSNIIIDKHGKWASFDMKGLGIPASGEYQGVSLTGCALTQTTTVSGNVDIHEAGNFTTAKSVVDQDATCTADYGGDTTLALNVSAKVTANSNGYAQ